MDLIAIALSMTPRNTVDSDVNTKKTNKLDTNTYFFKLYSLYSLTLLTLLILLTYSTHLLYSLTLLTYTPLHYTHDTLINLLTTIYSTRYSICAYNDILYIPNRFLRRITKI